MKLKLDKLCKTLFTEKARELSIYCGAFLGLTANQKHLEYLSDCTESDLEHSHEKILKQFRKNNRHSNGSIEVIRDNFEKTETLYSNFYPSVKFEFLLKAGVLSEILEENDRAFKIYNYLINREDINEITKTYNCDGRIIYNSITRLAYKNAFELAVRIGDFEQAVKYHEELSKKNKILSLDTYRHVSFEDRLIFDLEQNAYPIHLTNLEFLESNGFKDAKEKIEQYKSFTTELYTKEYERAILTSIKNSAKDLSFFDFEAEISGYCENKKQIEELQKKDDENAINKLKLETLVKIFQKDKIYKKASEIAELLGDYKKTGELTGSYHAKVRLAKKAGDYSLAKKYFEEAARRMEPNLMYEDLRKLSRMALIVGEKEKSDNYRILSGLVGKFNR